MKQKLKLPGFILSVIIIGCAQLSAQIGEMKFPEGTVQHVVLAKDIQWKPCPPNLPDGCEMTVLEGNPQSSDLFTIRFKISGAFIMPAHIHPKDERVTVLQGKAFVAFGKGATQAEAKEFGPGDYYVMPETPFTLFGLTHQRSFKLRVLDHGRQTLSKNRIQPPA